MQLTVIRYVQPGQRALDPPLYHYNQEVHVDQGYLGNLYHQEVLEDLAFFERWSPKKIISQVLDVSAEKKKSQASALNNG